MSSSPPGRRSVAYLSYSSGEFDVRSLRMARSAVAAGWQATIYARLEPGHPDVEDIDGIRLVRVPAEWPLAVPGLRWLGRRRGRAALRAAARLRVVRGPEAGAGPERDIDEDEEGAPDGTVGQARWAPRPTGPQAPAPAVRRPRRRLSEAVPEPLRSWGRNVMWFPVRPVGWAIALDDHVAAAEIWHGMWIGSLPAIDRQRRRLGGRSIYDSRDVYMLARDRQHLARPIRDLLGWLERRLARRADRVLTVNEAYADLLTRQLDVPRPTIVMNCPDAWDSPGSPPDLIRGALGLDASVAVVLYQGQLITDRGIEQAMDAIRDVPGAVLVLLGYGPMADQLRAAAGSPPYLGKVHLLPAVRPDELLAWTASADVTVVPIQPTTVNHRFSTPQKLFESLAAGVPVVASDLPGMADIVQSTGVGVLCDPTSPASIAAAIRQVLGAPARERAELRARVRAAAREGYNWTAQARVLLATYDGLLGGPGADGAAANAGRSPTRAEGPPPPARPPRSALSWRRVARRLRLDRAGRLLHIAVTDGPAEALRRLEPRLRQAWLELRNPSLAKLRQRASLADRHGEPTAGLAAWTALAAGGSREARTRARADEGLLRETDPGWLPPIPGRPEALEPVDRHRILHLVKSSVPDRWSGYTIRTINDVRAQRAVGLEPIVVTEIGWPRSAGVTRIERRVEVDGIAHLRLDRGPRYHPRRLPSDVRLTDLAADLVPVVRDLRPALIQAHSGHHGGELALVALALRARLGIPVVYEVRGLFEAVGNVDDGDAERAELFQRRLAQETRILREVDGILAISEALIELLAERGIPRDKMSLLPNGIDPAAFTPQARDLSLRRQLGLEDRFVVGYVGNLDHRREGIQVLIAALAELRRRGHADLAVLIVGDGDTRPALVAAATAAGVADGCCFTGRVPHDDVVRYYAEMDLFVNPRIDEWASRYITPLKPFEAMALGLPVLVSDLPALREIVDPPHRGLTAPPSDPAGLADAITRLRDDGALRERVASAGRAWVLSERSWAANGPRYRAAYEAILGPLD